jgi:hypothetical protein
MEEPVCKKMKRDLWGNPMETVTETEVSKLQKEIIDEGINKKSYTDSESDDDSDEEVIKLFKKKFIQKPRKLNMGKTLGKDKLFK